MASPASFDLERLLKPIAEAEPAGPPLRSGDAALEEFFYRISDTRDEARDLETAAQRAEMTQGTDDPLPAPSKSPNWPLVVELGQTILAERSKDLWVTAWLVEGLCRTHGFAGLRDGFRLVRELCLRYWEQLHPRQGDPPDDLVWLMAKLSGVLSQEVLATPIGHIPITGSCPAEAEDSIPRYSTADYRRASRLDEATDPEERRQQMEQGGISREQFDQAIEQTTPASFLNLHQDATECLEEFNQMSSLLDEKCGLDAAPPTTQVREAIEECLDHIGRLAKDKLAEAMAADQTGEAGEGESSGEVGPKQVAVGEISSRDEAFRELLRIADYFRKTEPHSVVSYSLEQVVRWGRMSLPQLLRELISNEEARNEMFRQTGMGSGSESGQSDQS